MRRDRDRTLVWLAVLLVAVARPVALPRQTMSSANYVEVPRRRTGEPTWQEWARVRLAMLATQGISDAQVALSVVAHWAFETGYGAAEWNFNVGNKIALKGEQAFTLPSEALSATAVGRAFFRAYDTLEEGISDYLHLVRGYYAACWALLLSAPESSTWVECLGAHGYYTANPAKYVRGYEGARARLMSLAVS